MARVFPRPLLRQQQKTKIERVLLQPPAFLPGAQFAIFHLFFSSSPGSKRKILWGGGLGCVYMGLRGNRKKGKKEDGWMRRKKPSSSAFQGRVTKEGKETPFSSPLNSMPPWPQIAGPDMARERRGKSCARISVFFTMIQKKIFRFILLYQMVEKERPFEARPTDRFFFPMSAKLILHCLWLFAGLVWPEK